jgi:uncharacterized membrane-anchored protein
MASKFFKKNFKSMNEEDKEKWNKENTEYFNEYRKKIIGIAAGDKEIEFLLKQFKEENE